MFTHVYLYNPIKCVSVCATDLSLVSRLISDEINTATATVLSQRYQQVSGGGCLATPCPSTRQACGLLDVQHAHARSLGEEVSELLLLARALVLAVVLLAA